MARPHRIAKPQERCKLVVNPKWKTQGKKIHRPATPGLPDAKRRMIEEHQARAREREDDWFLN